MRSDTPEADQNTAVGRVTVVETVYYQVFGESAVVVSDSRFNFSCHTGEQFYERRCRASEDWTAVDTGWVEEPSVVVLTNTEGYFPQVNPTEEQRDESARKVLEVSLDQRADHLIIPPRESQRLRLGKSARLFVRSQSGLLRYTVHALPR